MKSGYNILGFIKEKNTDGILLHSAIIDNNDISDNVIVNQDDISCFYLIKEDKQDIID